MISLTRSKDKADETLARMIAEVKELRETIERDQQAIDALKAEYITSKTRAAELRRETVRLMDELFPVPGFTG